MKRSFKKLCVCLTATLATVMCATSFAGCSSGSEGSKGTIRYLNFKPEIAEVYNEISDVYLQETGVLLDVQTAASGTYETTLKARMSDRQAPALFQINGPVGYSVWKDYTADLKDTKIYDMLSDKDMAVKSGDGVYGIPYVVEGYGIIYNDAIMQEYLALEDRATTYATVAEINTFDKLKAVVEDMQAKKEVLGINGVFAATSLKAGEDWRWQTHLANVPVAAELAGKDLSVEDNYKNLDFTYSENYKNLFDLYLNNSTTAKTQLGTVDVNSSMAEVALGQAVMVQNGNWGASQLAGVDGATIKNEDIKFLPLYMGLEDEETQGLCIGTENFICINSQVTKEEQKLAADFLEWLYSSEKGKDFVVNKLKFIPPFSTFAEDERPTDPLSKEVMKYMDNKELKSVPWSFTIFPSQTFKDNFGANLLQYAQGTKDWADIVEQVKSEWTSERA